MAPPQVASRHEAAARALSGMTMTISLAMMRLRIIEELRVRAIEAGCQDPRTSPRQPPHFTSRPHSSKSPYLCVLVGI